MTDQNPTGVFVQLPLSNEQLGKLLAPIGTLNERMLAIGTPVTGGDIPVVTTLPAGALPEPVPCIRQSESQAQIAARDAEIARLREALDRIQLIPFHMMDLPAGIMQGIAHKALKDGAE